MNQSRSKRLQALTARRLELKSAMVKLADETRQVIIELHEQDGMTFQDIAPLYGVKTRARIEAIYSGRKPKGK